MKKQYVLFAVFAVIVGWAVWQINVHGYYGAAASNRPVPSPTSEQRQPQLHTQSTGETAFTVNAGGVHQYKMTVPAGAYDVKVKGHFSAEGGSGNDIEMYVLGEDDYVNWKNGHPANALYRSGRVTQRSLDVVLPANAGTYYVLFSNKYSVVTPKAVNANLSLSYYTR